MQAVDMTGMTFGYLTVLRRAEAKTNAGKVRWHCRCICGREVVVVGAELRNGHTVSCGCYSAQMARKRMLKHGEFGTRLYRIWANMKERCTNQNTRDFLHYGGKGVKVCAEWLEYKGFRAWALANGYTDDLTIDRIDNDGNYEPENCQWITLSANSIKRNKLPDKLREHIKTLMLQGMIDADIVRLTGVSRKGVRAIRTEIGAPTRQEKRISLYNTIREMLETGKSVLDIAETMNMKKGTVYSIRTKLGLAKPRKQTATE